MGQRLTVLLVGAASLTLASCGENDRWQPQVVDASEHTEYFLWAGVEPPAAIAYAETVYLLAGEVRVDDPATFHPLRAVPSVGDETQIWLTVRVERLDWDEAVYARVLSDIERWDRSNNLAGLQIDFDAATRGLDGYAAFLRDLRERLPERHKLSVTGLMDWSARGDPAALAQLGEVLDEVVIQTYQGRTTIPGYERYVDSIMRLPMPYKVALAQGGEWTAPEGLESDPEFRGYVVFLVNDPPS